MFLRALRFFINNHSKSAIRLHSTIANYQIETDHVALFKNIFGRERMHQLLVRRYTNHSRKLHFIRKISRFCAKIFNSLGYKIISVQFTHSSRYRFFQFIINCRKHFTTLTHIFHLLRRFFSGDQLTHFTPSTIPRLTNSFSISS